MQSTCDHRRAPKGAYLAAWLRKCLRDGNRAQLRTVRHVVDKNRRTSGKRHAVDLLCQLLGIAGCVYHRSSPTGLDDVPKFAQCRTAGPIARLAGKETGRSLYNLPSAPPSAPRRAPPRDPEAKRRETRSTNPSTDSAHPTAASLSRLSGNMTSGALIHKRSRSSNPRIARNSPPTENGCLSYAADFDLGELDARATH